MDVSEDFNSSLALNTVSISLNVSLWLHVIKLAMGTNGDQGMYTHNLYLMITSDMLGENTLLSTTTLQRPVPSHYLDRTARPIIVIIKLR